MPPKRKLDGGSGKSSKTQKKRNPVNTSDNDITMITDANPINADSSVLTGQSTTAPAIDYDKLAAAIMKQSANKPSTDSETIGPQQEQQTTAVSTQPQLSPTDQGASTSGIGAILDQVFLGGLQNSSSLECRPDCNSSRTFENLSTVCQQLLASALSPSSAQAYRRQNLSAVTCFREQKLFYKKAILFVCPLIVCKSLLSSITKML
ncbi:uncharacterized protein LOC133190629 [Saccostrea echinata]|uniref:uncharacterized protein LOC133190629 n=1 Tax=Saccostrea echinata TaxID=191078 RepID=UPI002A7FA89D|nr:uncharacterized protein LOC133190629 [Saccostrea echinata]